MKQGLRFDHREIAVIFSLFIFVSLLMFTVGILVGKGLTQAKYEGGLPSSHAPVSEHAGAPEHSGNSVSLGHGHTEPVSDTHQEKETAPAHEEKPQASGHSATEEHAPKKEVHATAPAEPQAPLKLIPLKPSVAQNNGSNLSEPTSETEALLKNPKLQSIIESDVPEETAREVSNAPATARPLDKGAYTVQVGSYPNETAAKERVESLKKMGFTGAFFSAKDLGGASGTWFRVWVGSYPDYASAKKTGDQLQARGEVKKYIVRKN